MNQRYLTITLRPDWKASLRESAKASKQDCYQGEVLNFESPAQFFGLLTEKRWELVRSAQGKGPLAIRELSRLVGKDVKRVHEDVGTTYGIRAVGAHRRCWRNLSVCQCSH